MKATATIVVARSGNRNVVVNQRAAAPFSIRQCGDRILLASSAAAPVGGDELCLDIDIGPGAQANIGSVAATMAWPGVDDTASTMVTTCAVGDGGHVDLALEPMISVAESRHRTITVVRLQGRATCRVVEETVLGRTNEVSGRLDLSIRVERDGQALLHHDEAFGPDVPGALSSVSIGAARHAVSAILVGIDAGESRVTVDADRAAAWLPVATDAAVALAIASNRPRALSLLAKLHR